MIKFFVMMLLCGVAFAEERVTSFKSETISVLNEELRRSQRDVASFGNERAGIESRISSALARLSAIDEKMKVPKVNTNLCLLPLTTASRSLTYSGTFTAIGSAGNEIDGNDSTRYGGSAAVYSGSASITLSETITFSKGYNVNTIFLHGQAGGGGSGGGGGVLYCKVYNSSGSLIETVYTNTQAGTITLNATYTTGWTDLKSIEIYAYGNGGGQFGGSGSVFFYEVQAWAKI